MATEDYVSFEIAKLLKERGFDDMCHAFYDKDGIFINLLQFVGNSNFKCVNEEKITFAPTLQMAMKWLREEHNIFISIQQHMDCSYVWYAYTTEGVPKGCDRKSQNYSYEQACEAAIQYCLENLI